MNSECKSIIHASSLHRPFEQRIFTRELQSLNEAGYQITYITKDAPDEEVNDIRFVSITPTSPKFLRIFLSPFKVLSKIFKQEKPDLIHLHSPELLFLGLLLRMLGYKVIMDVHEDVPEQIKTKDWIPSILKPLMSGLYSFFEQFIIRFYSGIIAAEPVTYNKFNHTHKSLVRNFPLIEEFGHLKNDDLLVRENIITYIGRITEERGILDLLDALLLIPDEYNVKVRLAGDIDPISLKETLETHEGWKKVDYLGFIDRSQVVEEYKIAKLGVMVLHSNPKYENSYPVKLFEFMGAGIPSIISDFDYWKELIDGYEMSLFCNHKNPERLADMIMNVIKDEELTMKMGQEAKRAFESKFNWESERESLLSLYSDLLS